MPVLVTSRGLVTKGTECSIAQRGTKECGGALTGAVLGVRQLERAKGWGQAPGSEAHRIPLHQGSAGALPFFPTRWQLQAASGPGLWGWASCLSPGHPGQAERETQSSGPEGSLGLKEKPSLLLRWAPATRKPRF